MFVGITPRARRLLVSAALPVALAASLMLPARGETVIVNGAAGPDGPGGGVGFAGGPGVNGAPASASALTRSASMWVREAMPAATSTPTTTRG